MAEGFVLNIPKEMLDRLQKADEKIEKLDKNSRRVGENIRLAFMEGAKGVDKFIGSLNAAQKILDGFKDKKINVGLNLDAKAIDDLKKQLSTAGVNIPVGVTGTGSNAGGSNLSSLIAKIDTINQILNQILAQTTAISNKMDSRGGSTGGSTGGTRQTPYTQKQLESLNKKARTALYREELNALQRLTYAEKEKARGERENDKKNQIAHRQRMVELQQQEREIMRLAKAYRSMPSSLTTQSVNNLLAESKYASTTNQRIQAIKNLKNALKDISKEDANYKKNVASINKEIRRQEQELAKLGHRMNDVSRRSQNLFNISQQLGRALSLMFSVSQIGQYISKMVNIRKEMELQQRSLQVLLQSKDKANELWNQTLDLAVKSPFRVKELVTYTKQLAAYRIESDKLFETNKMLADVSAGLGVDMQRLILAFGQVKSASFLRGTELRQFTEAGIPMLEELARYFEELYGRSVSVAEVFDMISKRMVTFTDVETVFQRMTSAGGVFFNMQEELSQTTAGMISNLQDSIDLMFNEIGKKNQGIINTAIKWARGLVDNWETVGMVMKGTLVTLLAYQSATGNITNILYKMRDAASNIAQNFKSGFSLHPVSMALTALAMVIAKVAMEWKRYKDEVKKVEKAHADVIKSVNDIENGFSDLFSNNVNDVEEYKNKLQELVDVAKQKYNIEVKFKVNELDNFAEITEKFDELKAQILILNDLSKQFGVEFAKDKGVKWGWFQDFIGEDLTQLGTKQQDIKDVFSGLKSSFSDVFKNFVDVEQLDNSLEEVFNKIDSFGIDVKTDLINKFKDVIDSPLDLEGKAFDEVLKELNINDLTNENKEELERLVRNFIETERVLKEKKSSIGNLNKEIFESFKPQSSDEIDRDYLQRQFEAIKLVYREREKLKKYYVDKGYNTSALMRANEDIKSMYGFELDTTFYNDVILPYEKALGEATNELNDFYKANEGYVKNVVSDLNLLGTSAEDMAKEVSVAISSALKNVATEKELSPFVLEEMLAQAEEYYSKALNLELDLMPKIQPVQEKDLEQWQRDLKAKLEKNKDLLQGSIPMVTFQTTQEKALKDAEDAWKGTESLIKRIENAQKQSDNDLASWYSQYNLEELKKKMQVEKDIWTELGGSEDKKGKNTAEERIKEQIRLIKELYQEYQKLSKSMGAQEAFSFVSKDFAKLFEEVGLNINDIDFTNISGVVSFLEGLRPKAEEAGKDAKFALEKAISETAVELTVMFHVQNAKAFENEIKDMFSDYEIGLELEKLDIPADWAEQYFGIENVSLEDIQTKLNDRKTLIENSERELSTIIEKTTDETQKKSLIEQQKGYKDEREFISKQEQKINELIAKQQYERLKTYLAYARKSIGERAKLKLEEYNKLAEIDKTFKANDPNLTAAKEAVTKETAQKLDKIEWEEFQKTDTFINLFRDLENASEVMLKSTLEKLNEFKSQWSDMPLEDMKQVIEKINELEQALANLNPRETIKTSRKNLDSYVSKNNIKGGYSGAIVNLEEENFKYEMDNMELENLISNLETYNRLLDEGKNIQAESFKNSYLKEETDLSKERIETLKDEVKLNKDNITNNQTLLNDAKKLQNAYLKQAENIGKVEDIVSKLKGGFDSVVEAASALGKNTENVELFGGMANDIISSTLGMVQLQLQLNAAQVAATGFGAAMNTALGVIGWIVMAVQIIAKVISTIAKANDNRLLKQIEEQNRKIETLEKSYDKLSKAVDEAFTTEQLKEYNKELVQTTQSLITAQKAAIAAQEQRKGSNNEGSDEWKELQEMYEKLEEYETQLEESQKNIYSKLTGGIMDDVLSTTESFVDAWYDAFKETGDGLKGLEDSFNEMLLNLVKRQAAMKIAGRFVDEWDKALERYASDGDLSNSEIEYYANKVKNDLPALSSQLETFFSSFDNILGDASGNLSGLQRGISSITEQQADILASYLNSIKFIVSDSNAQLKALLAAQTSTSASNPIVAQLQVIAQQASAINTLLNSLTAPYQNGGRAFKVVI